jgi:hypothetical protein
MWDEFGVQFSDERLKALLAERKRKALLKKAMLEQVMLTEKEDYARSCTTLIQEHLCCIGNGGTMEATFEASQ